jgi:hypothetical protein
MVDEVLTRPALLALVLLGGEAEGALEQIPVDVRVVGRDVGDELVDQLVVPLTCFENRHGKSVLLGFQVPETAYIGQRNLYPEAERTVSVSKRRRERKAVRLARLLVALDDEARETRPWHPRRTHRAALGTARA